jgi:hypothetical protein
VVHTRMSMRHRAEARRIEENFEAHDGLRPVQ